MSGCWRSGIGAKSTGERVTVRPLNGVLLSTTVNDNLFETRKKESINGLAPVLSGRDRDPRDGAGAGERSEQASLKAKQLRVRLVVAVPAFEEVP